jgi:hypothetical protein
VTGIDLSANMLSRAELKAALRDWRGTHPVLDRGDRSTHFVSPGTSETGSSTSSNSFSREAGANTGVKTKLQAGARRCIA